MPELKIKGRMNSLVCKTCGEVTFFMIGGNVDGFVRHGCIHSVSLLLKELLKDKIKARAKAKKAAKKKATVRKRRV